MTDQPSPVLYRRTNAPGSLGPAIPTGDLTAEQFAALRPDLRREVRHSALYQRIEPVKEAPAVTTGKSGRAAGKRGDA